MAWEFPRGGVRAVALETAPALALGRQDLRLAAALPPTVDAERLVPFYALPNLPAGGGGVESSNGSNARLNPGLVPHLVRGLRTGRSPSAGPSSPLARGLSDQRPLGGFLARADSFDGGASADRGPSADPRDAAGRAGLPARASSSADGAPGSRPPFSSEAERERWYRLQPRLNDGFTGPAAELPVASAPVVPEDGRWVTMQPKAVPVDAPLVRAQSPWRLERAAQEAAAAEAAAVRGRAPGEATPWPEEGGKWHTLGREGGRVTEPWEAPPEAGSYDEWTRPDPAACVRNRAYDTQPRWYELPGSDDGRRARGPLPEVRSGAVEAAEAAAEAAGVRPFAWRDNEVAPYEDSSRWYTLPNGTRVGPTPAWRDC